MKVGEEMLSFDEAITYSMRGQKQVGAVVLEIKSAPGYQLFSENDAEAVKQVRQVFSVILAEYAQQSYMNDTSMEILWSCVPAVNQSFTSNIDLKIVFRIVEQSIDSCRHHLMRICSSIITGLHGLKFVTQYAPLDGYKQILANLRSNELYAIRRADDMVGFNNMMFPYCYKYDPISEFDIDLDLLVGSLMREENSAVILQVLPTMFNQQERMYIANCTNALSRIVEGIYMPQMGMYRDARAEVPMRAYKKYFECSSSPVMLMNMFVSAPARSAAGLPSRVMSLMCDGNAGYTINYETCNISHMQQMLQDTYASPWLLLEEVMRYNRNPQLVNSGIWSSIARLASIYTPMEVTQAFRLPIGTRKITAGIAIHEVEKRNKTYSQGIINTADLSVGRLQNIISSEDTYIGINLKDLTKHMLVVGTPGSGKSTFLVGLMDRLWKQNNIPFLVIEPAKNEYRALIDSIPDMQIFSPGKNNVAPFVMNPFVPPRGVTLEKYKSIVKAAFSAAFEMWTPLDQLFDETLNVCYSEQGWIDSMVIDDPTGCFSLADFVKTYREVVASKGYTGEYKKQIEAAGVLRFSGLIEQSATIFDTRYTVPVEDILNKPTVIELSAIRDVKQKSFIIAMLLNNIYAYVEANNLNDGRLKNVLLLEEAHALLAGDTASQGDTANANAAAVKLLTDMLAEIRSRGVGIVVADQSPKKVTAAVIGNTNVKVMFRLVEADDKDIVKRSTVMSDIQWERLSKLRCGQAMFFFDKLDEVEEIAMDDYRLNNGISTDLSDEAIRARMTYWQSHAHLLKPYDDCDCIEGCTQGCTPYTRERARIIADRIFRKNYPSKFNDLKSFAEFYKMINPIIMEEVMTVFRDERVVDEIACCVKVHLLRKVHYNTEIEIGFEKRKKIYQSIIKPVN